HPPGPDIVPNFTSDLPILITTNGGTGTSQLKLLGGPVIVETQRNVSDAAITIDPGVTVAVDHPITISPINSTFVINGSVQASGGSSITVQSTGNVTLAGTGSFQTSGTTSFLAMTAGSTLAIADGAALQVAGGPLSVRAPNITFSPLAT